MVQKGLNKTVSVQPIELSEKEAMKKHRKGKLMSKDRGYVCVYHRIQTVPDYGLYLIRG